MLPKKYSALISALDIQSSQISKLFELFCLFITVLYSGLKIQLSTRRASFLKVIISI